ncbi:MAG TPA: hypothetical protein VFR78_01805 [Pyrinomonadaceae bacterium]|nr:hypothetical protein [Pyrinomonadaceae bacterium]
MFQRCVLLFLLVCHGVVVAQETRGTAETPKPSVSISFARQALRENDATPVDVWVSFDSDPKITSVALRVSSPDILEWYDASCQNKLDQRHIQLDPAESSSAFYNKLCLKSKADITSGEYNVLFTIKYQWTKDDKLQTAMTSVEKTVKVNLLGSDSLAGIPLALAGLIVPGFCFLLVLRATKMIGTDGADLMIYGVVASLGFIALAKLLRRFVAGWGWTTFAQKLQYLDASSNVSVDKLMWLAISGASAGVLVALVYYSKAGIQNRKRRALEIKEGDENETILWKLLKRDPRYNKFLITLWLKDVFGRGNESYRPMTTVRIKDGEKFIGTLGIRNGTSARLLGSFRVVIAGATDPNLAAKLRRYKDKGWLLHVYKTATSKGLQIRPQNEVTKASDKTTTGNVIEAWDDDVTGMDFSKEGSAYQPLDVP